jgi:hypothetical protein
MLYIFLFFSRRQFSSNMNLNPLYFFRRLKTESVGGDTMQSLCIFSIHVKNRVEQKEIHMPAEGLLGDENVSFMYTPRYFHSPFW